MRTDAANLPPRFASDFGAMMLQVYGSLCAAREKADPDDLIVEFARAESTVNGVSALIVLGNTESIDRFMAEKGLEA